LSVNLCSNYLFCYRDAEKPPSSFYIIRVTSKPPCVVINVAFLNGTPGYLRHKVILQFEVYFIMASSSSWTYSIYISKVCSLKCACCLFNKIKGMDLLMQWNHAICCMQWLTTALGPVTRVPFLFAWVHYCSPPPPPFYTPFYLQSVQVHSANCVIVIAYPAQHVLWLPIQDYNYLISFEINWYEHYNIDNRDVILLNFLQSIITWQT
jgi:hypothetical protein